MKLVCAPSGARIPGLGAARRVNLFGAAENGRLGAGNGIVDRVRRRKLAPTQRAWDFLSIALSAVAADFSVPRKGSPDGWTREFELEIAVSDPDVWNACSADLQSALSFLTTDRWALTFRGHGPAVPSPSKERPPSASCVALLSGGLDSFVGALDRHADGEAPYFVSQIVTGDAEKQKQFAATVGGSNRHLQLNHNVARAEPSERSRSSVFLAFGVVAATAINRYRDGERVPLYACENGFIALNPPLTPLRIGSLSTRTAHPDFLRRLQLALDSVDLKVDVRNPYAERTKGEMLQDCGDQPTLRRLAASTTSCGRYRRHGLQHCGRCVPCQVRRAAFLKWGKRDTTPYVYEDLGIADDRHAAFDDVRSVALALAQVRADGVETWGGSAISSVTLPNAEALRGVAQRGLVELGLLHRKYRVR